MSKLPTNPRFEGAVARIYEEIGADGRKELGAMKHEDLILCHFGLGVGIRNALGLHFNQPLVEACGASEADGASMNIIEAVWERIRGETQLGESAASDEFDSLAGS